MKNLSFLHKIHPRFVVIRKIVLWIFIDLGNLNSSFSLFSSSLINSSENIELSIRILIHNYYYVIKNLFELMRNLEICKNTVL